MAFSFVKLISSSDTLTKREAAILKICPPAIITSEDVIVAEYDAILGQWEHENFYNHPSNYTKTHYNSTVNSLTILFKNFLGNPVIIRDLAFNREKMYFNHAMFWRGWG